MAWRLLHPPRSGGGRFSEYWYPGYPEYNSHEIDVRGAFGPDIIGCTVRDPYDRAISIYKLQKRRSDAGVLVSTVGSFQNYIINWDDPTRVSDRIIGSDIPGQAIDIGLPCWNWAQFATDIIRYEDEGTLTTFANKVGLPVPPSGFRPHVIDRAGQTIADFYFEKPAVIAKVETVFADDFTNLGYVIGGSI